MEDPYLIRTWMESERRKKLATPAGLENQLKGALRDIKSRVKVREGKLGTIYFGDDSNPYSNPHYDIGFQNGSPIITVPDFGSRRGYVTFIGMDLFKEIFNITHNINRTPSFKDLTIGQRGWYLGGGIFIDMTKGTCPFDTFDREHRFSTKTFLEFLERVRLKGNNKTVESVEKVLYNLNPAVYELLSHYSSPKKAYGGKAEDILVVKNDECKYAVQRR